MWPDSDSLLSALPDGLPRASTLPSDQTVITSPPAQCRAHNTPDGDRAGWALSQAPGRSLQEPAQLSPDPQTRRR